MLKPPLPNGRELAFVPARHDVNGNTPIGIVVNAGNLLGCNSWVPWPRKDGRDELEALGAVQKCLRQRYTLMLVRSAVGGREADLRERILETVFFGCSSVSYVRR